MGLKMPFKEATQAGLEPAMRKALPKVKMWGRHLIPQNSLEQMAEVCRLPIYEKGALFPDSHLGYGLPIGAAVATRHIIPFGVGLDIGCQLRLTVYDVDADEALWADPILENALRECTYFGQGSHNDRALEHPVMDRPEWKHAPPYAFSPSYRDKASVQLASSGGGNHFVELGTLNGKLALASHSGSRWCGSETCDYFTRMAETLQPRYKHLAWLSGELETAYLIAHDLMVAYASANHELIHQLIAEHLGIEDNLLDTLTTVHNEVVPWADGLFLHRKGATGFDPDTGRALIPGTMCDPGYVVKARQSDDNLASCSHGAGRNLSRRQARAQFKGQMPSQIAKVKLLGGDVDELPHAYKPINQVLAAQKDIIDLESAFLPRLVRMSARKPGKTKLKSGKGPQASFATGG